MFAYKAVVVLTTKDNSIYMVFIVIYIAELIIIKIYDSYVVVRILLNN